MDNPLDKVNDIDGLSNYISERQKELQKAIIDREIVETERYQLQREILELQNQVKTKQIAKINLDEALNKSKSNCMLLVLEVKRATSKFWNVKNG